MKRITSVALGLVLAANAGMLANCEGDPSAPRRPRTQLNPMAPDEKARDNAEKRELETPAREFPTSGKEFPGASQAAPSEGDGTVLTANAVAASRRGGGNLSTPTSTNGSSGRFPENRYNRDWYNNGPIPHLPENPGSEPMAGSTQVPLSDLQIDHSWGQVMVLKDTPHRNWPTTQTVYMAANTKYNPVYFTTWLNRPATPRDDAHKYVNDVEDVLKNIQHGLAGPQSDGTYRGDMVNLLYDVPWFYVQIPVTFGRMFYEGPLSQVTGQRLGWDPNYFSSLPTNGIIVPQPVTGVIKWDYSFLYMTAEQLTKLPATGVIVPTPGIIPAPLGLPPAGTTTMPRSEPPSATPGLK
ncbi:MAG: hypothetical protein FWD61_15010 [Phycisphaerales bacterium]|nr:hypothetical protein [Phycisphaerales bacterium]